MQSSLKMPTAFYLEPDKLIVRSSWKIVFNNNGKTMTMKNNKNNTLISTGDPNKP